MASKIVQRTWTELLGDHDWARLVGDYRQRPCAATSHRLLAALEPAAKEVCRALRALEGGGDHEDIWQQYQLELLSTARGLHTAGEEEWITIRLLQGARRKVSRWLRRQRRQEGEALTVRQLAPGTVEEAALEGLDPKIAHPLYRRVLLGERYDAQARRLGISVAALRKRVSRDLKHLRLLRASGRLDSIAGELGRLTKA